LATFVKAAVGVYAVAKAFAAAKDAAVSFVSVSAKFEQFETTLESITGSSEKAKESMSWITDFTSQTPYELGQVTEAFVKMKAYGIDPTTGTLKTLGDTASAMGKPIQQAVEAMADALVGENERLKEFGIKAKRQGEEIAYAWTDSSGASREIVIDNNKAIIESTLNAIFNEKYVGAMDAQSKTWNGIISNMKDEWTLFQQAVMDEGLFTYLKAMALTVKEMLGDMFGKGKEGAKVFSEYVIDGIKSSISAFGFLGDAIDGIKLAFKAVEFAVLGMSRIIMEALNYPIEKLNEVVGLYNAIVGSLGGEAIQIPFAPTIDTTWTDNTMAALKQEMGDLVASLANQEGMSAANDMIIQIDGNLAKLTATQKENNVVKEEAINKLAELNAGYVETGLVTGMATEAEIEKIYADEMAAMGLDAVGDELTTVNGLLAESMGFYDSATGAVESYANSINSLSQTLSAAQQQGNNGGVYKTVVLSQYDFVDPYSSLTFAGGGSSGGLYGFASGGYTGNIGTDDIAGVVHGQEYVINAQTTADLGLNGSGSVFESMEEKLDAMAKLLYESTLTLKKLLKTKKSSNTLLRAMA